jgi:hypothetical protein
MIDKKLKYTVYNKTNLEMKKNYLFTVRINYFYNDKFHMFDE